MKHLLIYVLITCTSVGFAQKNEELEVRGTGRVKAQPDVGVLNVSLTSFDMDFKAAVAKLSADYDKMCQHLETRGFKKEEIKTASYGVHENKIYRRGTSYDSGFVGEHRFIVEFENSKAQLEKIIEAFTNSPVKAKFSLAFTLSDQKRKQLHDELLKKAIEDAKQNAVLIAGASGQQLGKIKTIQYGTADRFINNFGLQERVGVGYRTEVAEGLGFEVREITLEDNVTVTYYIK